MASHHRYTPCRSVTKEVCTAGEPQHHNICWMQCTKTRQLVDVAEQHHWQPQRSWLILKADVAASAREGN
jgi:hypothetical protein